MTNKTDIAAVLDRIRTQIASFDTVILKERDVFVPAAAFYELVSTREAQGVPVAWIHHSGPFGGAVTRSQNIANSWIDKGESVTELFTAPQLPSRVTAQDMRETFNYLMTEEEAQASANGFNQCVSELSAAPKLNTQQQDGTKCTI